MAKVDPEVRKLVGENLRRERNRAQLTQEELAEKIGMNSSKVSQIECGNVGLSIDSLRNICMTLQISSDRLLFRADETKHFPNLSSFYEGMNERQAELATRIMMGLREFGNAYAYPEKESESTDD